MVQFLNIMKNFKQIFIGKSLIKKLKKDGGQNPIDAAKMGALFFMDPMFRILRKFMII